MQGVRLHLARHVLRTSAHKLLIPGQKVYRYTLRIAMLLLRDCALTFSVMGVQWAAERALYTLVAS